MNELENTVLEERTETIPEKPTLEVAVEEKSDEPDEISILKAELESLRAELKSRDEKEQLNSRMLAELMEFQEYFPEVDIHQIPNEVWEQVKRGASLSASFALNLKKIEIDRKKVSDFNEKNRRMSAGALLQGEGEKYYSPAEVKKMTPAQIKSHYDEIVESMRHWN